MNLSAETPNPDNTMKPTHNHPAAIAASLIGLATGALAAHPGSEEYRYDDSGNIVKKTIAGKTTAMSYGPANRLTSINAPEDQREQVVYDAAGRPAAFRTDTGKTTRTLRYGYADKVLEAKTEDRESEFFYNAEGRLVGKRNAGGATSTYTWDGNVLAADATEIFVNEDHITGGVPVLSGSAEPIVSDHLGNTLASGEKRFAPAAYGEGLEEARFTGKPYVEELGAYVFQHRFYSGELARWTTSDPLGYADGINSFSYVGNKPLEMFDALGLEACKPLWVTDMFTTNTVAQGVAGTSINVVTKTITTFSTSPAIQSSSASGTLNPGWSVSQIQSSIAPPGFSATTPTDCSDPDYHYRHWENGHITASAQFKYVDPNGFTYLYPGSGSSGPWATGEVAAEK